MRSRRPALTAAGLLLALSACSSDGSDSAVPPPRSEPPGTAATATPSTATTGATTGATTTTLPLGSGDHATLRIASGFTSVQIVAADLGDELVAAHGAADATAGPVLTPDGAGVTVTQPQGAPSQPVLVVRLARSVTWRVRLDGGASTVRMDLSRAQLAGVQVTQGVSSLVMTLPEPTGTLPVHVDAGASSIRVRVLGGAPARATMGGGASVVTLYGVSHQGISAGTRLTTPGWAVASDRVDLICSAGVSDLVVTRA